MIKDVLGGGLVEPLSNPVKCDCGCGCGCGSQGPEYNSGLNDGVSNTTHDKVKV